jgi:hypothetical protein
LLQAHLQPQTQPMQQLLQIAPILNASLHVLQQQYQPTKIKTTQDIPANLKQIWADHVFKELLPVWFHYAYMKVSEFSLILDLRKSFWLCIQSIIQTRLSYFDAGKSV